ncbi:DUF4834 family protein [Psychroserpens burtonensis]|uniref:DUF4834 family protein n=1 Tax=Psychroserpens burtonensis TaxID=49278 RepID=A0A5C7BFK4_9FLAO|nr:DUF4834 family protein [Psychroserpens burtonensis]TXE17279.1 DUF4834 family protein [Psychroserpens burtonensis]
MLQQASLYGFVRTILIIVLVYYAIKISTRLFAPYLMRYMSKKMQQKFEGQFGQQHQQRPEPKQKEGETVIDKIPNRDSSSNNKVGEYIDYEDVD